MSMAPMSCFRYAHDSKDHTSIGILLCAVDVVVRGHAGIVCLVSIDQLLDHLLRLLLLLRVVLLRLLLLVIFLLRLFLRPDRDDVGGPAFPQFAHDVDRIGGADHRHLHLLHVHRDGIDPCKARFPVRLVAGRWKEVETQKQSTLKRGDGLHRLLLVLVIVQVHFQHNFLPTNTNQV